MHRAGTRRLLSLSLLLVGAAAAAAAQSLPLDFAAFRNRDPDTMAAAVQNVLDARYPNGSSAADLLADLAASGAVCAPAPSKLGGRRQVCAATLPRPGLIQVIREGFFDLFTATRLRIVVRDDGHDRIVARRVVVFFDWR